MIALRLAPVLGLLYLVSELALAWRRRSARSGASQADRASLRVVWIAVVVAMVAAIWTADHVTFGRYVPPPWLIGVAAVVFAGGIALRWWAILTLGRWFTVDVAIHAEQRVVTHGPYRYVRHPSYTGSLVAFLGVALLMHSVPAILVALAPIAGAMAWRIHVEEGALRAAFGDAYRDYAARTRRLVPFVY